MPEPLISCVCARARACVPARACVRDGRAADFLGDADAAVDELGDGVEVRLLEAARRERRRADADAARDEGRLVAGDRVLVDRHVRLLDDRLDARAWKGGGSGGGEGRRW